MNPLVFSLYGFLARHPPRVKLRGSKFPKNARHRERVAVPGRARSLDAILGLLREVRCGRSVVVKRLAQHALDIHDASATVLSGIQ